MVPDDVSETAQAETCITDAFRFLSLEPRSPSAHGDHSGDHNSGSSLRTSHFVDVKGAVCWNQLLKATVLGIQPPFGSIRAMIEQWNSLALPLVWSGAGAGGQLVRLKCLFDRNAICKKGICSWNCKSAKPAKVD